MILDSLFKLKLIGSSHSHGVSVCKTITWRVLGTIDTMVISYLISGELQVAYSIGIIEVFTKMILYYLHERLWNKLV